MQCDIEDCKRPAEYNLQSGLILWSIDKKGDYSKNPIEIDADDEINFHLCEAHYEECEYKI